MTRYPALAINVAKYASKQRYEGFSVAEDFASLSSTNEIMRLRAHKSLEPGASCLRALRRLGWMARSATRNPLANHIGNASGTFSA